VNVCVIPGRGGSRRIKHKNRRMFHGKELIGYSIECALQSNLFADVYVSTDDEDIAHCSRKYGATVMYRPPELARDEVGTQKVMQHALREIGERHCMACCLYATAPLVTPLDLQLAYDIMALRPCRYVVSVATNPLRDIGNFYMGTAWSFIEGEELWCTHTGIYVMPAERAIDINTEEDFARAEEMYSALHAVPV
jgi:pseudaminic acid cytidylyltransferase